MAKCVKLTDEVYLELRDYAKRDELTIAGEVKKIMSLRKIVDEVKLLEQIASRLGKVAEDLGDNYSTR